MSTPERWPDPEVREVVRFLALGYSASAIAKKLGRSRSAVLGLVHRRNLRGEPSPAAATTKKTPVKNEKPSAAPARLLAIPNDTPAFKTYDNVRHKQNCTFMIGRSEAGDGLYCCAPTENDLYCQFHRRVMYQAKEGN